MKRLLSPEAYTCVIVLLASLIVQSVGYAQTLDVILDMKLTPRLPQSLVQWTTPAENITLTVTNSRGKTIDAKFDIDLRTDGKSFARTRLIAMPLLHITTGISTYSASDLFSALPFRYYNDPEDSLQRTASIPAGEYMLCLRLVDPEGTTPYSLPVCKTFSIGSLSHPVLLAPGKGSEFTGTDQPLEFRWQLPYTSTAPPARWLIRIVEASINESDSIAFFSRQPVVERIIAGSTSLALPTAGMYLIAGRRYVWSVRPYEGADAESSTTSLWATPFSLTILPAAPKSRK